METRINQQSTINNQQSPISTPEQADSVILPPIRKPFWADFSLWTLAASNLWATVLAIYQKWPFGDILFIFWFQSVIIGLFWFVKILMLKNFTTDGCSMNGQALPPTLASRNKTAFFFLFHYGFFHVGYAVFLFAAFKYKVSQPALITAAIFLAGHLFSFIHNRKWDRRLKPNLGTVMFFPYARIIPMHLTIIIFGGIMGISTGSWPIVVFFMSLKTLADLTMHAVEVRLFAIPQNR